MTSLNFESSVTASTGTIAIAGLDEAGRGALAGPVVAAAVILPLDSPESLKQLSNVDDSKKLAANIRSDQFEIIKQFALTYGIGRRPASYVDRHGIIAATKAAMMDALDELAPEAAFLLIDGRIRLPRSLLPQKSIIRGDSKSLSIAAASILAKVSRDNIMIALDARYPMYGFARHKGYGTQAHRDALLRFGPSPEHRQSFAPLRTRLL